MSSRTIITGSENPILRKKCATVKKIDQKAKKLAKDLIDTLAKYRGLGLSAPQIGENIRIILINLNYGTPKFTQIIMINPEILDFSEEKTKFEEGCLSLPKVYLTVERAKEITIRFIDLKNQTHSLKLVDLNARITQHEVDHLNGVLIVDKGWKAEKSDTTHDIISK